MAIAAGLTGALVILTLAVATQWTPLVHLDRSVASWAYDASAGHEVRIRWWTWVTTWGGPDVMRGLVLVGGAALVLRRRYELAVWLLVLAAVEALVAPASKALLGRPRARWDDPIMVVGSTSFPSGHATAAATAAVAVVLVAASLGWRSTSSVVVTAAAGIVAALVAASRIFLGVHYLSDVVGGLLLGAGLALITYISVGHLWAWGRANRARRRS